MENVDSLFSISHSRFEEYQMVWTESGDCKTASFILLGWCTHPKEYGGTQFFGYLYILTGVVVHSLEMLYCNIYIALLTALF